MTTIATCQGPNCTGDGSSFTIRDLEDLAYGLATVQTIGCLGHCNRGPNISVSETAGGRGKVTNKVNKFSKCVELLENAIPGFTLDDVQKKVGKLKYNARRDDNPAERKRLVDEAMSALDKNPKAAEQHPELLAQVLTLRARESLKASPKDAYRDIMKAVELCPNWAYAKVTLSQALDACNMPHKALVAMNEAIKIGNGIDKNQMKRAVTRLERRKEEVPEDAEPPAMDDNAEEVQAKSTKKPKAKSKKKAKEAAKAPEPPPAPVAEEDYTEIKDWDIIDVKQLNHDCISMKLKCPGKLLKEKFTDECWHVDLVADIGETFEEVKRSYTPASSLQEMMQGHLELMIKIYDTGKLTSHLKTLKAGDKVLVTIPHWTLEPNDYAGGMVMIAGGSAVTIALQACQAVLARTKSEVHLFLCNKTAEDVLYQDRLEEMLKANASFHVTHCLSQGQPPASAGAQRAKWHSGRLQESLIEAVPKELKAVISGPRSLCRWAYDTLLAHGRQDDQINCLDDLPEAAEETVTPQVEAPAAPELVAKPPPEIVAPKAEEPQGWFFKLFGGCKTMCVADFKKDDAEGGEIGSVS